MGTNDRLQRRAGILVCSRPVLATAGIARRTGVCRFDRRRQPEMGRLRIRQLASAGMAVPAGRQALASTRKEACDFSPRLGSRQRTRSQAVSKLLPRLRDSNDFQRCRSGLLPPDGAKAEQRTRLRLRRCFGLQAQCRRSVLVLPRSLAGSPADESTHHAATGGTTTGA